jgi:hypothetical protein
VVARRHHDLLLSGRRRVADGRRRRQPAQRDQLRVGRLRPELGARRDAAGVRLEP